MRAAKLILSPSDKLVSWFYAAQQGAVREDSRALFETTIFSREGESMEIAASQVSLSSTHTKTQFYQRKETLLVTGASSAGESGAQAGAADSQGTLAKPAGTDSVTLSSGARRARHMKESDTSCGGEQEILKDLNLRILKDLVERVTGKKIRIHVPSISAQEEAPPETAGPGEAAPLGAESIGWGLDYRFEETRAESETITFAAQGQVMTTDGCNIDFSVSLSMSRKFVQKAGIHVQAGDAVRKDPLVVNFGGNAAELSQTRFAFDIDCDGNSDQVSCLAPQSGYLAVDKNQDKIINDGSELFGPETGHGFSELAVHDQDGNHWIDENDDIFDKLRIWTRLPSGDSHLICLGEKGIGAISLDRISTRFAINDAQNRPLGEVLETGVFLTETGGAGTVQELDLMV
jgi:hypothetical protein